MNANATKTPTAWHPFCDAGRLATPASDPAAASGYADGIAGKFEPWRWDGADSIVYKAAHASGWLDRVSAEKLQALGDPATHAAIDRAEINRLLHDPDAETYCGSGLHGWPLDAFGREIPPDENEDADDAAISFDFQGELDGHDSSEDAWF